MNPSVSRIHHDFRFSCSIASILGFIQGGEIVTARATAMIRGVFQHRTRRQIAQTQPEKLRNSKFNSDEELEVLSRVFDERMKKDFSVVNSRSNFKFDSPRDNDPNCGRMTLTG